MNPMDRAEATALVMASLCMRIVAEDPELLAKVQQRATDSEAPVPADRITTTALGLADLAVMHMARRALAGRSHVADAMASHEGHQHQTLVIPVPNVSDGAAQSAGALVLGSFLAEYAHKNPAAADAFRAWMTQTRPDMEAAKYVTQDRLEATDQVLTLMAHMADQVAGHEDHQHEEAGPGDIDLGKLSDDGHRTF